MVRPPLLITLLRLPMLLVPTRTYSSLTLLLVLLVSHLVAGEAYSNLLAAINFAAQDIYKSTLRGAGNFVICSPVIAAMLSSAAKLEGGIPEQEEGELGANIQYKGKSGNYETL